MVEVCVLGPLEVHRDGEVVPVPGGKPRVLFLALVVRANEPVSQDRLIDALWGDEPPPRAGPNLHVHVATLRKLLNGDPDVAIDTSTGGYALRIPPEQIDALRFEELVREARGRDDAADRLRQALALWRGPALPEVADEPFAQTAARRLEESRLAALEQRIDADLALGRDRELVPELESLVADYPLRERLAGQLMHALYASGRQAEALAVYRDLRRRLVDELGIEPSPELQALERAILQQDAALTPPAPARPRKRRRLLWTAIAVVTAIALAGGISAALLVPSVSSKPRPAPAVAANSLVQLDPGTGRVVSVTKVGDTPVRMAVADGAVWVVNRGDRTVSRVDLRTHRVRTIGGVPFADDIAADSDGNLWVSSSQRPFVTRLGGHAASFPDRPAPLEPIGVRPFAGALAVGSGYLWVTNVVQEWNGEIGPEQVVRGRKSVSLVDLRTNRVVRSLNVPSLPLVIAVGYGSAWVGEASRSLDTPSVAVLSPGAASADVIPIRWAPVGMTVGGGSVWVLTVGGTVLRIDPNTRRIVATIPLNRLDPTALEPLGITYGANAVWVTNRADFSVSKINPRTNRVAARIPLGSVGTIPCGIAVTDNTIWVTMDTDVVCGSPANPPG